MIGYSDDAKMMELLAPLRRLQPVPFEVPERSERPLLRRPVIVAAVIVIALALTGVAIANGVGAFNGISAAQNTQIGADVLPPAVLATIKQQNAIAVAHNSSATARFQIPQLRPQTARVLGTMADGSKVYGLTDTRGDLCLIGEVGGSCGPPLSAKQPITMGAANTGPIPPGGTLTVAGVAIDGVTSVSFTIWGKPVTVPVKNNVYVYKRSNSTATGAHCIVAHLADGSKVTPFPEVPCP